MEDKENSLTLLCICCCGYVNRDAWSKQSKFNDVKIMSVKNVSKSAYFPKSALIHSPPNKF